MSAIICDACRLGRHDECDELWNDDDQGGFDPCDCDCGQSPRPTTEGEHR